MSLNTTQLCKLIYDTLSTMPRSKPADHLTLVRETSLAMMCAAHESRMGTYLQQVKGPALGMFQMEPRTHDDLFDNFLIQQPKLLNWVLDHSTPSHHADQMAWNLKYSICMFRVFFMRFKEPIPVSIYDQSKYLKKYWNTEAGKATAQDYYKAYTEFV